MNFEVDVDQPVYVTPTNNQYYDYYQAMTQYLPQASFYPKTQLVADFEAFEPDYPPTGVNFYPASNNTLVSEQATSINAGNRKGKSYRLQNDADRLRRQEMLQQAYQQKLQSPWYYYSDDLPVFTTAGQLAITVVLLLASAIQLAAYFLLILASTYFTTIIRNIIIIFVNIIIVLALLKVNLALKVLYQWCRLLLNRQLVGFVILLFSYFFTFTFASDNKLLFAGTILDFIAMGISLICCLISIITWLRLYLQSVGV